MKLHLKVWRQNGPKEKGRLESYELDDVSKDMSFLEMLDVLNEKLILKGQRPVEFDSDCREGICGSCGVMINGQAHGPGHKMATCQLHMRKFQEGQTIVVEPWRARSFPVVRDLTVDRSSLDRIIEAGGYVSVKTGKHCDGNAILIGKDIADKSMDFAECIGCGACVASCPNASAALFTGAKISHFALLPQGQVERAARVENMVERMDVEGFGNCTNIGECQAACPKGISIDAISLMRREYLKALNG